MSTDYSFKSCDICGDVYRYHHMCAGPRPLCECGCGELVEGKSNGVWSRWLVGHNQKQMRYNTRGKRKGE